MTVNPLIAAPIDDPKSPWAGIWIAEDIELIGQGVQNESWIDGTLGVAAAGLDGLALVSDPAGALLQYGIAWLIEHVRPLSEALDWLAGDPSQITAQAATWRNVAASLADDADELSGAIRADLGDWSGAAASAYQQWAARREQTLRTLARAAETAGLITEAVGALIGSVRLLVRDAVATVVSRLIVYAGELIATAGLATPLVVEQVATLCAAWGARIARWLRALIASLRKLAEAMTRLGRDVDDLKGASPGKGEPETPDRPPTHPDEPTPPDFSAAEPDPNKISRYAMNPDHPTGKHKYRVIHSVTGLDVDDAALIEQQIREGVRGGTPNRGQGRPARSTMGGRCAPDRAWRNHYREDGLDRRTGLDGSTHGHHLLPEAGIMNPQELDVVTLAVDLPDENLRAGDIGTVVYLFDTPATAYEVEFVDEDGSTRAMVTLTADQLRTYPTK